MEQARHTTDEGIKIYCRYDDLLKLEDFKPHPDNPNIHPDEQIELLADIFKNNGIRQPIKVSNLSGYIISGHGRLAAAKHAGMSVFPVEYQNYIDKNAEIADLLGDNKISELSEIDPDLLKNAIENAGVDDASLFKIGFSHDELQKIFNPIIDDIPEDLELEKVKAGSTRQNFIIYDSKKLIMTDDEKERFDIFISKYADRNGNYLGIVNELLKNGAQNYED